MTRFNNKMYRIDGFNAEININSEFELKDGVKYYYEKNIWINSKLFLIENKISYKNYY